MQKNDMKNRILILLKFTVSTVSIFKNITTIHIQQKEEASMLTIIDDFKNKHQY